MDSQSIKRAMRVDRYKGIKGLCVYFAIERRWGICYELLNALELFAIKDNHCTGLIMQSDLPVDLAK